MQTQSVQRKKKNKKKTQTFSYRANCFSSGVSGSGEGCLEGCLHHTVSISLSLFSSCVRLSVTLTSSSPLSLSPSHTSQFHSVSPIYCVLLSGTACPPKGSQFLPLSQMFFLPLGLSSPSHYPPVFCTHFIFHLNTFSLSLSHTHASPSQLDGSGSLSPPSPTYHRVYYICHHLLLA